ncbi:MAG: carbohydrate deacetylase [Gemmataceae bacterium]
MRYLIVNADDFGRTDGINRGIISAHERGIVTSASLMVRWPAAVEAAQYARHNPRLSVGLHLDLGEWIFRDGTWVEQYQVVSCDDPVTVAAEIHRQLATFRELMGRGPSHLDSHQHVHRNEPVRSILIDVAMQKGIPIRQFTPELHFCGDFFGQGGKGEPHAEGIGEQNLLALFASLPEGWTELGCHPGLGDSQSTYDSERAIEVATLCSAAVRSALSQHQIELRSFHDWRRPAT